jgi:hypothetical protein
MKEALHVISQQGERQAPNSEQNSAINLFSTENYLFNLSGGRKKINVLLSDILLVKAINGSHIDKLLYLKGNIIHTIRGHSLKELIGITGFLLQTNKQVLISAYAINYIEEDAIYMNDLTEDGKPVFVSLNRTYKKAFFDFFNHLKKNKAKKE